MSDGLNSFEEKMRNTRNCLVERFLTVIMNIAVWTVTNFRTKTDLEALLKIKTLSDKIEAELANELMIRNRYKKATNVKTFDQQPVKENQERGPIVEARIPEELQETQYFEANSDGSMNDTVPFEINKDIARSNRV